MELNPTQRAKADLLLQGVLEQSHGDEIVRALLYLTVDQDVIQDRVQPAPSAAALPVQVEVRREPAYQTWAVVHALRALGLGIIGDSLRYSLTCEGSAAAMGAALDLSFVSRARLERRRQAG